MSDRARGPGSVGPARLGLAGGPMSRWCPRCPRCPRGEDGSARRMRLTADRGSASVLVALWAVVLTMLAAGAGVLGSALAAREAVAAAADLAALAGASATLDEPDRACSRARAIARENAATLTECRVGGTEVWVVVRAPVPPPVQWLVPGRAGHLRARAHAHLTAGEP